MKMVTINNSSLHSRTVRSWSKWSNWIAEYLTKKKLFFICNSKTSPSVSKMTFLPCEIADELAHPYRGRTYTGHVPRPGCAVSRLSRSECVKYRFTCRFRIIKISFLLFRFWKLLVLLLHLKKRLNSKNSCIAIQIQCQYSL